MTQKANEAPEKIYFDGESKACKLPVFSSQNIEYIRIDAFIERAEEYIYKQLNEGCIECGDIEQFIGGMKNYIKGE